MKEEGQKEIVKVEEVKPEVKQPKERNHLFDNIRAIVMILVVFGHMLETFSTALDYHIYVLIYSFHMPLLIFVSGFFAKFDWKNILLKLVLPLFILQFPIFLLEYWIGWVDKTAVFLKPSYTLWFLLSLIIWRSLTPLLKKVTRGRTKIIIIALSFVIGLAIGFVPFINENFSLSRTFVYLPFFVLGYFARSVKFNFDKLKRNKVFIAINSCISIAIVVIICIFGLFPVYLIRGSKSYFGMGANIWQMFGLRIGLYAISIILMVQMFIIIPRKKITILSYISKYSLQIYLLHSSFVLLFRKFEILPASNISILYALLIAIGLVAIITLIMIMISKIIDIIKKRKLEKSTK